MACYNAGANTEYTASNVYVGSGTGQNNKTGERNTYIGSESGSFGNSGSYNVFIGFTAGYFETGSNKLYIANSTAYQDQALIYGEFDNSNLKLNATVTIRDLLILKPRTNIPETTEIGTIYFDEWTKTLKVYIGNDIDENPIWKTIKWDD